MRRHYPAAGDNPMSPWTAQKAPESAGKSRPRLCSRRWLRQYRGSLVKLVTLLGLVYLGFRVTATVRNGGTLERGVLCEGKDCDKTAFPQARLRGASAISGPPLVLLLTYQSVGVADLFGQLFNRSADVAYVYEPLDALYAAMFGTEEGQNNPTDILTLKTGTEREISAEEAVSVGDYLYNILTCDFPAVPTEFLLHHFWQAHSDTMDYVKCLQRYQLTGSRENCRLQHLAPQCSARFGDDRRGTEECKQNLWDGEINIPLSSQVANPPFDKYLSCLEDARKQAANCQGTLSFACQVSKRGRVIKTVRATMKSVEAMLEKTDVKVIHFYRDPRALMLSETGMEANSASLYGKGDLVKEIGLYCRDLMRDISLRQSLEKKYRNAIYGVDFDGFAQNPSKVAAQMFDFIGLNMTDDIRNLVRRPAMVKDVVYDAPDTWQYTLDKDIVFKVKEYCGDVFQALPYDNIN